MFAEDFDHPGPTWIKMEEGWYINLADPDPAHITVRHIARALAKVNRFAGHTPRPYSVLEHSLTVARMAWRLTGDRRLTASALYHDATEAYYGDVTGPLKGLLPEYRILETAMAATIGAKWDLSLGDPRVKGLDQELLGWEMAFVRDCPSRPAADIEEVIADFIAYSAWLGIEDPA